jgi:hypothetical protein
MSDGREEREEREMRIEQEKRENREDLINRDDSKEWSRSGSTRRVLRRLKQAGAITAPYGNSRTYPRPRNQVLHVRAATPRCQSRCRTPSRRSPAQRPVFGGIHQLFADPSASERLVKEPAFDEPDRSRCIAPVSMGAQPNFEESDQRFSLIPCHQNRPR